MKRHYIKLIAFLAPFQLISCSNIEQPQNQQQPSQPQELSLSERVDQMMVNVAGGTFIMGQTTSGLSQTYSTKAESSSSDNNDPRPDELPLHEVTVSDFEISQYEVTQGLWKEVMGTLEPCFSANEYGEDDERAMDGVSWDDAMRFLKRLNELTGASYRLPTEAEWEWAARGGNKSKDFRYSGSNSFSEVGWCKEDEVLHVQKVAQKKPNELGLYDMSGNAFEWCYDWYNPYPTTPQVNPKGPNDANKEYEYNKASTSFHVLRGGHWQSSSFGLRVSFRTKIPTTNYRPKTGFRIARGISYEQMNYTENSPSDDQDTFISVTSGPLPYRKAVLTGQNGIKPILVIYLHGGSARGNDNEKQINEPGVTVIYNFLQNNSIPAIMIVPQCPANSSWGGKTSGNIYAIMNEFINECQGVYAFGGSMGGTGVWSLANSYKGVFKGIMPVAGKPTTASTENFIGTRIYTVMSEADEVMTDAYTSVGTFVNELKSLGVDVCYDLLLATEGWGHAKVCEESYTTERLKWIFEL